MAQRTTIEDLVVPVTELAEGEARSVVGGLVVHQYYPDAGLAEPTAYDDPEAQMCMID
jgi:hypothetical protein